MDARRAPSAATAGDILTARLMQRGAAGLVTDGGLRDSPGIAQFDFPAYCSVGSAPVSLIRHHAADTQLPIGCDGVAGYPGDIVVGDAEGGVVIPAKIANEVAEEAAAQT